MTIQIYSEPKDTHQLSISSGEDGRVYLYIREFDKKVNDFVNVTSFEVNIKELLEAVMMFDKLNETKNKW